MEQQLLFGEVYYVPSEAVIDAETAAIRAEWTPQVRRQRLALVDQRRRPRDGKVHRARLGRTQLPD